MEVSCFRFDKDHSCALHVRQGRHPQARSELIVEVVKHKCIDPTTGMCKPKEIMSYMQMDYGVSMTYKKAWLSREKALKSLYGT